MWIHQQIAISIAITPSRLYLANGGGVLQREINLT
eukprot:CAMPEP_0202722326 /NCGR_PEP_ID=MMETSP1385-20130828/156558_1 /ASSEMBLY_ACC=CAM_ASM_000861 /TAXON_ID=933848 /ORGANISM="Elphidium margaritaceum" /LENGTH=34 /DNA_ID= /DNA_START= /DNA_END= /DNA_ORIENTATION=